MTKNEALENIGKPFKYRLAHTWDTIRSVSDDGMITGDLLEAPAEECRLKQEQPPQLRKKDNTFIGGEQ